MGGAVSAGVSSYCCIDLPRNQIAYFFICGSTYCHNYWQQSIPRQKQASRLILVLFTFAAVHPVNDTQSYANSLIVPGEDQKIKLMKFGVVVFPGSNCDQDMFYAFDQILGQPTEYLWHKREELNDYEQDDVILVPGGFSYGDYLRAGAIARFSPIMKSVIQFAERGGKVLGVCNGFQILCETGLLPGTLLRNRHQKFISKNVFIKKNSDSLLTGELDENEVLKIPIAHAEGRYFAKEKELQDLVDNNQILFQYCDKKGQITEEANPNGSLLNIAGICNKNGNVFGMMPHPERAVDPALFNEDGVKILAALGHAKQQQLS